MKKKIIIASIIVLSLLMLLLSVHIFVLLNPRLVIFKAIESFEYPEWLQEFKSDFYGINGEMFGQICENQEIRIGTSGTVDIKNLKLGGDIALDFNEESSSASFFADEEKLTVTPDFYTSSLIVAQDYFLDSAEEIPFDELFKTYYECLESGDCDSLFSAKRGDITVLDKEFNSNTIISLAFTDDEVKALCGDRFDKNTAVFDISLKIDVALGVFGVTAFKAEADVTSTEADTLNFTFLLESATEKGLRLTVTDKSDREDTVSTVASFYYTEAEKDIGNGKIEIAVFTADSDNAKRSFSLPFEYSCQEQLHRFRLNSVELNYGGVIFSPSFNIILEASAFNNGFDIKIDTAFKFKKLDLQLELNLSVTKAYGFDREVPEEAVLLDENIKKDLQTAFCEHNPKTASLFGISTENESVVIYGFLFDFSV